MKIKGKRPNFLIITTDEERYPPPYENPEAKAYRMEHSKVLGLLRAHGLDFTQHSTAATACAPSRTSIYTGQYPSLHGVSQTPGIGKSSYDQNMFWLEPNTVPTMGNWFRAAGYRTIYRGKWHLSHEDIDIPGTQTGLLTTGQWGADYPERIALYTRAERLKKYGFEAWVGPEPHGQLRNNTGTVRDPGFADQVCRSLAELDAAARAGDDQPFLLVSSFVNPHDIVFSGLNWFPAFDRLVEKGKLPRITPAPTQDEPLESKPRCQKDYGYIYPRMYLPQPPNETYRQFYYYLIGEVNKHIAKVYEALRNTCFADETIVVFTSDHGELLGAHGGLHQKWYTAYQEVLHVPFIISNPVLFPKPKSSDLLTSHVDLLPTLLGLADVDAEAVRGELAENHSEARALVGRDLSELVTQGVRPDDAPIYYMTDDSVEVGEQMTNPITGVPYNAVVQPNHIETIITKLPEQTGDTIWKYTRYFDNPRFYSGFGAAARAAGNQSPAGNLVGAGNPDQITVSRGIPSEFECYNLTEDPIEQYNLLSPLAPNPLPKDIRLALEKVLIDQRTQKRLLPNTINDQPQPQKPQGNGGNGGQTQTLDPAPVRR